jgi:hypothetical protein
LNTNRPVIEEGQDLRHRRRGAVLEAVIIIGAVMYFVGPTSVEAKHMPEGAEIADEDRIVETLILDAKLPNNRTGVTYLYETEVYVQTKQRHTDRVRRELDQFQNEIRAELTAIWRTAEPYHFQEPRLENLTRKVCAMLNASASAPIPPPASRSSSSA